RRARQVDPHAAMNHLRVGKDLIERVDRAGGNLHRFELRQEVGAGPAAGARAQGGGAHFPGGGARRDVAGGLRRGGVVGVTRTPHSLANWLSLPVAMMTWPSATGKT